MTRIFRFITIAMVLMFLIAGCKKTNSDDEHIYNNVVTTTHDEHGEDAHDEHGEDAHDEQSEDAHDEHGKDAHDEHSDDREGIIKLDEHELAEFGITLTIAESGTLRDTTSLAGEITLNPDRVTHVVARAGGIGHEVLRTVGDYVKTGEVLAVLESPELAESKAEYLSRAAQDALATTDLDRAKTIHTNTIQLLEIIARNPNLDILREEIHGLDIGANRGNLITTYAELRAAEAIYSREKTLFEREITSESEYLSAESELKKAIALFQTYRDDLSYTNQRELDSAQRTKLVADVSLKAAERRLHALGLDENEVDHVRNETDLELARYEIRATITGRIIDRHLVRGESLNTGEQVFIIADLSSVWGQLTLYQRDLANVIEGQTVLVIGTHDLGTAKATIEYINPILDDKTRTTTARVTLDNQNGNWHPGMFIRAELNGSKRNAALLVPRTAIQKIGGEKFIFVETEEGLEPREVQIGQTDSNSVEIISGLQIGERYVVTGGLALKAELNKASLEHAGHAH